ncbi:MAG: phosphatidylglycerol lysyltransferase domain-containing protein [Clostridiales bacterium]|nr:phosphatidylglycerol lysyltransferase domain-containing protein [Clostridiales bacterium]
MGSFEPVSLGDKDRITSLLRMFPHNEASEYTFTNLFIWEGTDKIEWMEEDGFALFRTWPQGTLHYLIAYAEADRLHAALETAITTAAQAGQPFSMHSIPEWYRDMMMECMPNRFRFEREARLDDYIYHSTDLISLAGKKYQSKRNHINRFMNVYGRRYAYAPYALHMADDCMMIYDHWLQTHQEPEALHGERESVRRALYHADVLDVVGGVILVDDKPEAFSIGERLNEEMAIIHIEKANLKIPELFSLINRDFAANAFSDLKWINREEDMGDEGLWKAKQSYHPARMIEKYHATITDD